ncbi:MAG TPA: histidinol-phosphate transaminase [Epulopiscium sp.]|nr:histidinol-phosphate transaminase [Candidatus Epulonipiscium sp.]
MTKKAYIREDLMGFTPYKADHVTGVIKLDANENPYKMDEGVRENIINWLSEKENFSVYPDSNCDSLRNSIAKYYGVGEKQVVCGVGSDQLIDCMMRGILMPWDAVVYPDPSFSMYQSVITLNHGKGIPVSLKDDFSYDIEEMIKACHDNDARLLILCTPNNPTGNSLSLNQIRQIAKQVTCPIMVDEAYGEFNDESAISLINEFENIVVLRTFSKAYGLAGLRIGYGIGSEKALYPIEIAKPPYNVNTFTQMVAQTVIENPNPYKIHIEDMKRAREEIKQALEAMGLKVYPSDANFLLVECDKIELDEYLKTKNIHIRGMNIRGKKMYRISVGTKEQNEFVLENIKEAVN